MAPSKTHNKEDDLELKYVHLCIPQPVVMVGGKNGDELLGDGWTAPHSLLLNGVTLNKQLVFESLLIEEKVKVLRASLIVF